MRPDEPCGEDCDSPCYRDRDVFVHETTLINGWGAEEDVQALCRCEHHEVAA